MKQLLVALAAFLIAAPLGAQGQSQTQGQAQQPTFRTGVDVITVDVAALDSRGQPVTDLHGPEFTVKIDGQVRRVVSADLVKYEYTPDTGGVRRPPQKQESFETLYTTNITETQGRMIMIAVDQMNIRPGAARPILDAAARFLDRLNPADRVAFVSYPEPGIVVDFTGDRQRVRLAMQKVIGTQSRFVGRRNIGLVEAIDIAQKGDDRRMQEVTNRECRGLLDMALEQCMRDIVDESNSILWTTRRDSEASLRGLRDWLQHLGETEGQKTLILLSEGLVTDSPSDLEDVVRTAMRGRVAVNVLLMDVPRSDATQGPLPPTFTEDRELEIRGLNDLASLSRGSIFQVVGTADRAFDRLASEISAYYLLSVEESPSDRDGRQSSHRRVGAAERRDPAIAAGLRARSDGPRQDARPVARRIAALAARRGGRAAAADDVHLPGSENERQGPARDGRRRRPGGNTCRAVHDGIHRRRRPGKGGRPREARRRSSSRSRDGRTRRSRTSDAVTIDPGTTRSGLPRSIPKDVTAASYATSTPGRWRARSSPTPIWSSTMRRRRAPGYGLTSSRTSMRMAWLRTSSCTRQLRRRSRTSRSTSRLQTMTARRRC